MILKTINALNTAPIMLYMTFAGWEIGKKQHTKLNSLMFKISTNIKNDDFTQKKHKSPHNDVI